MLVWKSLAYIRALWNLALASPLAYILALWNLALASPLAYILALGNLALASPLAYAVAHILARKLTRDMADDWAW